MSRALYRKYRSKSLADIVGQSHVTDILSRSLAQGKIAHAYLLTGPRGVGKTSIARILAHEINQLPYEDDTTHLDIIEIDAASNNGVEDVRELREKVQIAPVSASKKIYIIDEVHMLSKAAFNALLKTLEEPPEHAVFILATTDADKLPATIISRTQPFHFRAISPHDAVKHLRYIATSEGITIDDEALTLIAARGQGSFRDSISLLDQLSSLADERTGITKELALKALGLAPAEHVDKLLAAYEAKDIKSIVALLDESEQSGVQASALADQLIQTIRLQAAAKPQLLPLLDVLLEVAKSSQPSIKLLTALTAHLASPKPKSAALSTIPSEISVSIGALKKSQRTIASLEPSGFTTTTSKYLQPERESTPGPDFTPGAKPFTSGSSKKEEYEDKRKTQSPVSSQKRSTFEWLKFLDYTREHFVAMYSVLSKCSHELSDTKLVLYTGNNFYKKKLDSPNYRSHLATALSETSALTLTIETIGTAPPPKDRQAAAVAAIMGGGEEVAVDI